MDTHQKLQDQAMQLQFMRPLRTIDGHAIKNRRDLIPSLNDNKEHVSQTETGSEFQSLGPVTEEDQGLVLFQFGAQYESAQPMSKCSICERGLSKEYMLAGHFAKTYKLRDKFFASV